MIGNKFMTIKQKGATPKLSVSAKVQAVKNKNNEILKQITTFVKPFFTLVNFPITPSEHYKGMNICTTGEFTTYKDRPQIIAIKPDQIAIQ